MRQQEVNTQRYRLRSRPQTQQPGEPYDAGA
jgi:hypothetical protein